MRRRRPRWRAYLLLARVSNLPTIWTNVLAGLVVARVPFGWPQYLLLCGAVSLLYVGGMFLNDAFDSESDATFRPDRPIPAGDVPRGEVIAVGAGCLVAGELILAAYQPRASVVWALALAAAIVYYDYRHKRDPFGPAVMGLCRGLVYCVAAASTAVTGPVIQAAVVLTGYVTALTLVAKRVGPHAGWLVSVLIAGISLVDAGFVSIYGPAWLAWLAASGFVLTLLFQRVVPGS